MFDVLTINEDMPRMGVWVRSRQSPVTSVWAAQAVIARWRSG